jgi:hypothetical protein
LGAGDFDAVRVVVAIQLGTDFQPDSGSGAGDEIDNHLVAGERPPPPVHRDVTEEAVFDLVPLGGAGGKWQTVMAIFA